MKTPLATLLCVSVAGCAVGGIPVLVVAPESGPEGGVRTPAQVYNADAVTPRDGAGAIVVSRDAQFRDRECVYDVSLDDQHVAGLHPGEQLTLYADPGERLVGISIRGEGECKAGTAQFPVQVIPHATNKVRVAAGSKTDLKVELDPWGGALPP